MFLRYLVRTRYNEINQRICHRLRRVWIDNKHTMVPIVLVGKRHSSILYIHSGLYSIAEQNTPVSKLLFFMSKTPREPHTTSEIIMHDKDEAMVILVKSA